MKTRLVRDPLTGNVIAVPASKVLVGPIEPGMSRTTSPDMRPMTGSASMRDMMSRLPDADLVGARGPGVVPGGEQGKGARRGQVEQERQPLPPHTYRPLGGAKQNYRGGTAEVLLQSDGLGSPAISTTGVIVQTPRDSGDDAEGLIISLGQMFSIGEDELNLQSFAVIVTAILQWGIGGANFTAEMDWNQGTVICLPASFASVVARVEATQQTSPGVGDQEIRLLLSAALAYGSANSSRMASPARKTEQLGILAAGATTSVMLIPDWANSVTVVSGDLNPNFTISLRPQGNTTANETRYTVVGGSNNEINNEHQFPIPCGSRYFTITNNAAGLVTGVKAIFNLSF